MSVSKFVGSFVQAAMFGGTYDDLAFEIRVLKGEIARVHERLDREIDGLRDRLDQLEGKPVKGKGRSRLAVVTGAEAADVVPSDDDGGMQASSGSPSSPSPSPSPSSPSSSAAGAAGLQTVGSGAPPRGGDTPPAALLFSRSMTIAAAHAAHPDAQGVFASHHLSGCPHCALSRTEALEDGAGDHGVDVEQLLADLNRLASC